VNKPDNNEILPYLTLSENVENKHSDEDIILRKLELLELQVQMMSDTVSREFKSERERIDKIERCLNGENGVKAQLADIKQFQNSVTGSWKGVIFTVVILWAVFGDKFKALFH